MRSLALRPTRASLFAWLMVFSLALLIMPAGWKRWLRGVIQPIGILQAAAQRITHGSREGIASAVRGRASPEDAARLAAENEELRRQLAAQAIQIQDAQRVIGDLSGLRDQLRNNPAKIIFGTVVGGSASLQRETLTIWPGSRNGDDAVTVGDWVTAGLPEELREEEATGRELLMRQWLIGRVVETFPFRSTIRLTTDADFRALRVVAARRLPDGRWQRSDHECLLYGMGDGKMQIKSATIDFFGEGYTHALAVLPGPTPIALCVGTLAGSRRLPEAALHFDIDVKPPGDVRRLANVYVLSMTE